MLGFLKYILSVITDTLDSDSSKLAPTFYICCARVPGIELLVTLSALGYN